MMIQSKHILAKFFFLLILNLASTTSNRTLKLKTPIKCRLYSECIVDVTEFEQLNFGSDETILNSSDVSVFNFEKPKIAEFRADGTETYKIKIIPVFIGHAKIEVFTSATGEKRILTEVIIERPNPIINTIFDVYLWVYCGIMSFCMGALIENELVHRVLRGEIHKQIGVAMFCQIFAMPLIAFVVGKAFQSTPVEALAFFIYGITPGAFESSQWASALGADVELNSFASLFSTIFSIITMPAYLYLVADSLMKKAGVQINLIDLSLNLAVVIVPCIFGYFIGNRVSFIRKLSSFLHKVMITVIPIIVSVVLQFASKFYSFVYSKPINVITGSLISYVGYIIGASLAWIFGFSNEQIRSISIETGVQNTMLSMLIVNWNFPLAEVDIVLLLFVPILFQASTPLQICDMYKKVKKCIRKRRNKSKSKRDAKIGKNATDEAMPSLGQDSSFNKV